MNPVQLEAFARQVLPIVGTLLTVFGVKAATANALIDLMMSIVGPLMTVGSMVWMFIANRNSAVISKAASLPEVKSVTLEASAPQATLDATPSNVTK